MWALRGGSARRRAKRARYVFALTRDPQLGDVGCNPPGFVNCERVSWPSD